MASGAQIFHPRLHILMRDALAPIERRESFTNSGNLPFLNGNAFFDWFMYHGSLPFYSATIA
jgi:hypothetical protein